MTQIELSTMHSIINGMDVIAGALLKSSPRYVQITPNAWVNPSFVSAVAQLPENQEVNRRGGFVNVVMNSGDVYQTEYHKAEEVIKMLTGLKGKE